VGAITRSQEVADLQEVFGDLRVRQGFSRCRMSAELSAWAKWCWEASQGKHPEAKDMYGKRITANNSFPASTVSYWLDAYERNK